MIETENDNYILGHPNLDSKLPTLYSKKKSLQKQINRDKCVVDPLGNTARIKIWHFFIIFILFLIIIILLYLRPK